MTCAYAHMHSAYTCINIYTIAYAGTIHMKQPHTHTLVHTHRDLVKRPPQQQEQQEEEEQKMCGLLLDSGCACCTNSCGHSY